MKPKWMEEKSNKRKSIIAEKKFAKKIGGKTHINSGATLGQNDIFNDYFDIEHKMTGAQSYSFKLSEWDKLVERTPTHKTPALVMEFGDGRQFVVLDYNDFMTFKK